jgi:hypothetical protein
VQLRSDVRLSKRKNRGVRRTPSTIAPLALPEPDAPRPRRPAPPEGEVTVPVSMPLGVRPTHSPQRERTWPRTRAEVDVALHSIGLAIDDLLEGAIVPEENADSPTTDLRAEIRERFENAAVDARRVDVIVDGERVILVGIVGDPLSRLIAEDIAWSLPRVSECENRLAVV